MYVCVCVCACLCVTIELQVLFFSSDNLFFQIRNTGLSRTSRAANRSAAAAAAAAAEDPSSEEKEDDDDSDDYNDYIATHRAIRSKRVANRLKSVPKKKQAPKKRAPKKLAPLLCCAGDQCKQQEGCTIIGKGHTCAVCEGCMHGFPCSDEKVEVMVGMTCKKCALTGRTARGRTPPSPLSTQTNRRGRYRRQEPKAVAVPKDPLPTRRSARNK